MKNVLICDVETTGLDRDKDQAIELGYVLWSVEHRVMLEVYSGLLPARENPAEAVNGIPARALPHGDDFSSIWNMLRDASSRCDAIVAHQADFDRAFLGVHLDEERAWICTIEDLKWPRQGAGNSLIAIALAHGVGIVAAHRAINDCLTLARLFEAVPDIDARLEAAHAHALLPKGEVISLAPFEEKEIVKAHGFKWFPERKVWARTMALADAKALPFGTRAVARG